MEWHNQESGEVFSGYRENGYFPDAFINMLAFLGWNPGTAQELFSLDELVAAFSLKKVNKAGARYDHDKTRWFNQQYLRHKSDAELGKLLQAEASEQDVEVSLEKAEGIAALMKERAYFIKDLWEDSQFFFAAPQEYDEKTLRKKWNEEARSHVAELQKRFEAISDFNTENIEEAFKAYLSENELGFGKVGPGFRLAVTGMGMGPSMFEICAILGKEETLSRLNQALEQLP